MTSRDLSSAPPLSGSEPVRRYGRIAMALHWIVAALIAANVVYGLEAASADDAHVRALVDMHKSIGLTLLGLVLLRVLWRFGHRPPPLPSAYLPYERKGAHMAHALLYVVMLALPLSGYIHDSAWKAAATHPIELYGVLPFPRIGWVEHLPPDTKEQVHSAFGTTHTWLGYALYALFALHIGGVLKHHLLDREPELARMLPGRRHPDAAKRTA